MARATTGLTLALASAASFGLSGGFASSLLDGGWSPGAAVTLRIVGAALVLVVPALMAMRGRWHLLRGEGLPLLAYGALGVVGAQLCYFQSLAYLPVGVALMLEYTAPLLVVGWLWLTTRRAPGRVTALGGLVAMLGLVIVLDPTGRSRPHPVGVLWALAAAVGAAAYFILAARGGDDGDAADRLPPIATVGLAMMIGALLTGLLSATGLIGFTTRTAEVQLIGQSVPWWVSVVGMVMIATVLSYLTGLGAARRLGSKVASFVALTEVIFAVLAAWLLVGQLPGLIQAVGGALIVVGVVVVRWGDLRDGRPTDGASPGPPVPEPSVSANAAAS